MSKESRSSIRRWIRRGFLLWAVFSVGWLANSMRTRGVESNLLQSDESVSVFEDSISLQFQAATSVNSRGLLFICGSGVAAKAYAPMLRPLAQDGISVIIVKLPLRFAPLEVHKQSAVDHASELMSDHPEITHWIVSGHSLGGALACRLVSMEPRRFSAMILVGTTHPKESDLSSLMVPVAKIYASEDGVAPPAKIASNAKLLPKETKFIEIAGGNHSQFGNYGHQLFDGKPSIGREEQQSATRAEILAFISDLN